MISSRFSVGGSVLARASVVDISASPRTPLQSQMDGLVSRFVQDAANPITLAAMMAGGMAYRFARVGVMGLNVGAIGRSPLRVASIVFGLGSEVTAFEFTSRLLQTVPLTPTLYLQGEGEKNASRLWSWSGPGGWAQGLSSSAITFGMLRGAGFLAREQNLIFQHTFQSSAMVAGHHTAGFLGIASRPEGSLAEQLLHAEATNIQLATSMGLVHSMTPELTALERGLDLSIQNKTRTFSSETGHFEGMRLANVVTGNGRISSAERKENPHRDFVLQMSSTDEKEEDPPPTLPPSSSSEAREPFASLILDNEPYMILLTDPSHRIVWANHEAHQVLGVDLQGKTITDLLRLEENTGLPRYRFRTESGLDLLWEDRPHPFKRQLTAHYLLDVTGRVETERLLEELKIKASEGHLAREVIHDARSALSPTQMLMQRLIALLETQFPEGGPGPVDPLRSPVQIARLMKESVEQTMGIFNTGMNILRGGVGEIALDQVLLEAINLNQPLREKNNVQITIEMPAHLGIYGNKRGLLEVLNNLLVNACEAMPEGGEIRLRAYPQNKKAVIEVSDTGPGIPQENLEQIFKAGFTTKGDSGSGIGLSTVRKIIEQLHRGNVEVESEEGRGTTFRIRLPLFSSSHPPAIGSP